MQLYQHLHAAVFVLAAPSIHWGCSGELWDPSARLPADWSFAGYAYGDQEPPTALPIVADIKKNFGAKGDNVTDDTQAFLNAIAAVNVSGVHMFCAAPHSIRMATCLLSPAWIAMEHYTSRPSSHCTLSCERKREEKRRVTSRLCGGARRHGLQCLALHNHGFLVPCPLG